MAKCRKDLIRLWAVSAVVILIFKPCRRLAVKLTHQHDQTHPISTIQPVLQVAKLSPVARLNLIRLVPIRVQSTSKYIVHGSVFGRRTPWFPIHPEVVWPECNGILRFVSLGLLSCEQAKRF
jgi:hypothetical protein